MTSFLFPSFLLLKHPVVELFLSQMHFPVCILGANICQGVITINVNSIVFILPLIDVLGEEGVQTFIIHFIHVTPDYQHLFIIVSLAFYKDNTIEFANCAYL